jgi:hypothetical protein
VVQEGSVSHEVLTACPAATVHDIGEQRHDPGTPFGPLSLAGLEGAGTGPAGALARACVARGYRVEQEASTRAALDRLLRT